MIDNNNSCKLFKLKRDTYCETKGKYALGKTSVNPIYDILILWQRQPNNVRLVGLLLQSTFRENGRERATVRRELCAFEESRVMLIEFPLKAGHTFTFYTKAKRNVLANVKIFLRIIRTYGIFSLRLTFRFILCYCRLHILFLYVFPLFMHSLHASNNGYFRHNAVSGCTPGKNGYANTCCYKVLSK